MYCGKCGKNNDPVNRFCDRCGAPLEAEMPALTPVSPNPVPGNGTAIAKKKQGMIYLWIFLAIVIVCAVVFGIKVIAENNKKNELNEVHSMLLRDWDTKLDPSDTETTGLELDFTMSELSINRYHYSGGQRRYNSFNGVVTYKYEVISPSCIKTWYKGDSPRYYSISFNDDYTVMYFNYDGENRVLYAQRTY